MLLQMTQLFVGGGRISVIHTPKLSISNPQFGTPPVNTNKLKQETHLKGSYTHLSSVYREYTWILVGTFLEDEASSTDNLNYPLILHYFRVYWRRRR